MPPLIVRFAKRQASWEGQRTLEELQQLEFRRSDGTPDLEPSVYLVTDDPAQIIQAYAEHTATPPIKPEKTTIGIDAVDCADRLDETPGSPRFAFIRAAHREFVVPDLPTLLGFVGRLRDRVLAKRVHVVTREQVIAHARACVTAGHTEWIAVARLGEKDWLSALQRLIPAAAND